MNKIIISLMVTTLLCGCAQQPVPAPQRDFSSAVDSLNKQIEEFNVNRMQPDPTMGIFPIDKRVSRIEHDQKLDHVTAFDLDGNTFFVLKRESDGRFKGVIKQKFHQLAGAGPDGKHYWGHVMAEFYLEKGMF